MPPFPARAREGFRWLAPCKSLAGVGAVTWNRYAYVYNSPVNYTDSSGHFIDTLWDVVDTAVDLRDCLATSDSLSCYMLPADVAFLALPFVPGVVDNTARAARWVAPH